MAVQSRLTRAAVKEFQSGLYCSEAIVQVCNRHYKLGLNDAAIKMASGFGAGLGGARCCCGCLTGGVMVVSAMKGRIDTKDSVDEVFSLSQSIHDSFKTRFKATCCRALTREVVWGSPEHHRHCEQYVSGAMEILQDVIKKNKKGNKSEG